MAQRLDQIVRCMDELEKARRDMHTNPAGAALSELDWLDELHYHIHPQMAT